MPRLLFGLAMAALCLAPLESHAHPPIITIEQNIFGGLDLYRYGEKQSYWAYTGWGLPDVFEGVPEAVQLAERYQIFSTTGVAVALTGNALFVTTAWYRLKNGLRRGDDDLTYGLMLGGAAMSLGGTVLFNASRRLIFQAVNLFNRRAEPKLLPEFRMEMTQGVPESHRVPEYQLVFDYRFP